MPAENAVTPLPPAPLQPAADLAVQPREFQRITVEQLERLPDDEHRRAWISALVRAELARQNYAYHRHLARETSRCRACRQAAPAGRPCRAPRGTCRSPR